MKKYIYFIILFLFLLSPINVVGIVSPTSNFFVNDSANILSSETEDYIFNKSVELNNIDGTQIVVVTVKNLEGYSLEEYANRLFNSWGIGDKEKNNGLLLLLALEEREFRVEVGDGLGGILPDAKTGRFQDDYMIPYFRNNDWDNGMRNGYDAFYSEIVKLNGLDISYNNPDGNYTYVNDDPFVHFIIMLFPIGGFIGLIAGLIIKSLKTKKRNKVTKWYFIIWALLMIFSCLIIPIAFMVYFINIFVFSLARFSNGNARGSSYGGYRSSSSRSFSSRFSGGGGRSSGGGSSRRF